MTTITTACDALDEAAMLQATELAAAQTMPYPAAWRALTGEFLRRARDRVPNPLGEPDGRTQGWRVRVRLYLKTRMDEPEADSDPDLPAELPGATMIYGLTNVADHLRILAADFHGAPCAGLDSNTLAHRLKSLRPTISRRGGDAVWRVPYVVEVGRGRAELAANGLPASIGVQDWLARVDIVRVEK